MDNLPILLLKIFAVAVLVGLNGFFVAAEFALVKIRDTQLDPLIAQGQKRAVVARLVLRNLDRSLSAAQLGITLASLGLGWIGEPVFAALLEPVMGWLQIHSPTVRHSLAFAVGFTSITFLHITAGEQAPKWLAIQKPLPSALWVAGPLNWFCRVAYPFIWVLNHSSLWMLRQLGISPGDEHGGAHSEEELRLMFTASQEKRHGHQLGRDIVLNALDLPHRIARQVMRPRRDIVGLNTHASIDECLALAEQTRFSRFPLCEDGDLDRTVGVVHIKDLYAMRLKARTAADLMPVARKIIYAAETARLETLLHRLLERRLHLAIIVDEYGGTTGMVTLENIIEELVGQIQDEFDQEKPLLVPQGENIWSIDGALPLHELESLAGQTLEADDEVATVSGWVTRQIGTFPARGAVLRIGRHELCIEEVEGVRVSRLTLRLHAHPPGPSV